MPNQRVKLIIKKNSLLIDKLVVLDVGGRDEPFTDELLSNIDYISPNEVLLFIFKNS